MHSWRYLPYAVATGAENMAIDEAIQTIMSASAEPEPVLRFYGWNPATLSLGYAQSYDKEVDEEACKAEGIDIVRRPTGGRAVLHQYELTYSVIAPERNPLVAGTITESYLKISRALVQGFQSLGIPAELSTGGVGKVTTTAACFDAPSWYELVVDGRKLVGSAQVRKEGMLLQHGSILLRFDADLLFRLLKFPSQELRARLLNSMKAKACALDEVSKKSITIEELEREICHGFEKVLGVSLQQSRLTPEEKLLSENLCDKYSSFEWTKKR